QFLERPITDGVFKKPYHLYQRKVDQIYERKLRYCAVDCICELTDEQMPEPERWHVVYLLWDMDSAQVRAALSTQERAALKARERAGEEFPSSFLRLAGELPQAQERLRQRAKSCIYKLTDEQMPELVRRYLLKILSRRPGKPPLRIRTAWVKAALDVAVEKFYIKRTRNDATRGECAWSVLGKVVGMTESAVRRTDLLKRTSDPELVDPRLSSLWADPRLNSFIRHPSEWP